MNGSQQVTGTARAAEALAGAELEDELSIAAELAYLNLSENERRAFAESVGKMLEFFATMDGFKGADTAAPEQISASDNRLRADCRRPFKGVDLVELAPLHEGRFVGVPNIL